jgi:hypothetical protein
VAPKNSTGTPRCRNWTYPNVTKRNALSLSHSADAKLDDSSNYNDSTKVTVFPATPVVVNSIDATTAITIILIASFAIDRLVTLLMVLLPFARLHGESAPELLKKRERLTYILLAGLLGLLLGYFGDIHLLAGLGFSTNVALNAIVTALILTAGSDSISALLKKMGGSLPPEAEPKPLIVQGDLTLKRPELARATAPEGRASQK